MSENTVFIRSSVVSRSSALRHAQFDPLELKGGNVVANPCAWKMISVLQV